MTCLAQPPATLDAFLATIDRCATAAGGADWASQALLGLQALVVLLFVLLVGLAVVGRVGR